MPHRPHPFALSALAAGAALCLGAALFAAPAAAATTPSATQTAPPPADIADSTTRVDLPGFSKNDSYPYTIEVPVTWGPRRDLPAPGAFLGPPSGTPDSNPEMLLVHTSKVQLSDPAKILSYIEANTEKDAKTKLEEGKVEDFGSVKGLWIVRRLPPAELHGERVHFWVKLPMPDGSLDVTATVPVERVDMLRPEIEKMLHSIRPAEAEPAPAETPDSGGATRR
jgi:hypothetical protein